jgi:hypothetical protein
MSSGFLVVQQFPTTINVKNYGAVGDGSHDDTAAITAAIAAIPSGGGELFFPPGNFISSPQILYANHWWRGSGYGATTLTLKASSNATFLTSYNFASLTGTNSTGGVYNCGIRDLTIDANKASNSAGNLLNMYGYGFTLANIRFKNAYAHGVYSEWSTSSSSPGQDAMEAVVYNFKIHDCGGDGINWNGPHDSQFSMGNVFLNGTTTANANIRFSSSANTSSAGCQMESVHAWGGAAGHAYVLGDVIKLTGCLGEGAHTDQCLLLANSCQIDDCWFFAAGTTSTKGIVFGDGTHTISNSRIRAVVDGVDSGVLDVTHAGDFNIIDIHSYKATTPSGIVGTLGAKNMLVFTEHDNTAFTTSTQYFFPGAMKLTPLASTINPFLVTDNNGNNALVVSGAGNIASGLYNGTNTGFAWLHRAFGDAMIGMAILANSGTQSADLFQLQDSSFNVVAGFDKAGRLKFGPTTVAPTAAAGTNAGGSPPAPVVTSGSCDTRGKITFGTGSTPAAGQMVDISFAVGLPSTPLGVNVTALNDATATLIPYVYSVTTAHLIIGFHGTPAAAQANTVYAISYVVII